MARSYQTANDFWKTDYQESWYDFGVVSTEPKNLINF
jgi:hypothetical protein